MAEVTSDLLTVPEAARLLRVSEETVRRRIRSGAIRVLGGPRSQRIRRADLLADPSEAPNGANGISPRTSARLEVQADALGTDPDTLLERWLTDFEEAVAGIQRGHDAAEAGDEMDFEEYVARDREKRRERDAARAAA